MAMSPLFENAIDSIRIGVKCFNENSSKHAILLVFHSIELLLKELLSRHHPVLIYKNIDKVISDDSQTVGLREIFVRFQNIGISLSKEDRKTLVALQNRRNRIEHHCYDPEPSDKDVLGRALKFIISFISSHLNERLDDHIENEIIDRVHRAILSYDERIALADHELEKWIAEVYPNDEKVEYGTSGSFEGTYDCPHCSQTYLVLNNPYKGTYCFFCGSEVKANVCDNCGNTFIPDKNNQSTCGCDVDDLINGAT